jgi:hypothetical protein
MAEPGGAPAPGFGLSVAGFGRLYNAAGVAAQDSQSRFASARAGAYLEKQRNGLTS